MASYLDRLIKMQAEVYGSGVTSDPATGGFILPDGMFLEMGMYGNRGDDHRIATAVLPRGKTDQFEFRYDAMVHVAKKIGMYRWMPESWSIEAWTQPTRSQLDTIEELAEYEPLTVEAWKGRSHYTKQYEEWDSKQARKDLKNFYRYGNKPGTNEEYRFNPPKTKIRKLSPNTEKMVGQMIDLMVKRPDSQWHPSLFSIGNRLRANVPPAVRYLKEMGMIEVAYKNINNQPVYTATAAFKEAAGVKRNPELKDLYGGTATQQINTLAQMLSDEGFTRLTHKEAIHALDTIGLPRSYAKKLKDKVAKMNRKRK